MLDTRPNSQPYLPHAVEGEETAESNDRLFVLADSAPLAGSLPHHTGFAEPTDTLPLLGSRIELRAAARAFMSK